MTWMRSSETAGEGRPPPERVAPPAAPGRGAELLLHALAAGFYVTLYGLVATLAFAASWFLAGGADDVVPVPGWALACWCAFTALFLVLAQVGVGRRRAAGRPLEREEAPGLFALLDDVGERIGVGAISAVRLKPAPLMAAARVLRPGRFAVTERRALVIGLPLLRLLSEEQMRAAVAHELAHLAGGDVQRGRIVNAAWRRIALMRAVLERGSGVLRWSLTYVNPVWWYLVLYGALLRGGAAYIRRRQESRADGLAARVVGREAYASALVHVACVGVAFRRLSPGLLVRAEQDGRPLTNFYEAFAAAYGELSDGGRRALVRDALATHDTDRADHPPLRERLDELDAAPPALAPEPGSCEALVPALPALEEELTPLVVRGLELGLRGALARRRERRAAAESPPADRHTAP